MPKTGLDEAICDHNKNLVAFLQRCSQRGVKLAVEKLQLCLEEVSLIGHYATKSGLKIHSRPRNTVPHRCQEFAAL